MNFKKPFKIEDIDIENIKFTDIKSNSKKTIIYLKYDTEHKLKNLVFQTPSLFNPNKVIFRNNNFELDIPLHGKYDDKVNQFVAFLKKLDKKIIKEATRNQHWFNNFIKDNKIKYQKIIRDSIDSKFKNGTIKLKLIQSNKFKTKYQLDGKNINLEDINENCWIKSILEVYAIWINDNGFGLFIRPILLSLKKSEQIDYNYNLIDDSDEIDDIIHTVNENSIFVKANNNDDELGNTTSILDIPTNDNYFEEIPDDNITTDKITSNVNLSTTSSN